MTEASPYTFEILQIQAMALFFTIISMIASTWTAYRQGRFGAIGGGQSMAVVALVGFVGLASAFTASLGIEQVILSGELAFGLMLAILRPANALAFFICLQFLRPWEVDGSSPLLLALPRLTGLIAVVGSVISLLFARRRLRVGRGQWFLLAFAVWVFVTTFASPTPAEQQKEYFDGFFRAVIMFFLIVTMIREESDLDLLRNVYLWSVAGLASISIFLSWDQFFAEVGHERLRSIGTLENSNDIAAIMVVAVPFTLRRMSLRRRDPLVLAAGVAYLALMFFALYMSQSRGALVSLAAGSFGWWVLRSRRRWFAIFAALVIVGCVAPFANAFLRRDSIDLQESSDSRLIYWRAGLRMATRSPLYGVGFNRYPKEYQVNAKGDEQYEFGERTAHSTWILALAETGLPGFLLFVAFIFTVIRMAKRIIPWEPDLFVALVAYLIAVSFLSHTWLIYLYILTGLVVAGFRMHYRSEKGWSL